MIGLKHLIVAGLLVAATPAFASEILYPAGSRIGLAPPPGLEPIRGLQGFGDRDKNVALVILPLPPQAYAELDKSMSTAALKKEGITLEKRESIDVPLGKAFVMIGRQTVEGKVIRKWVMVASGSGMTALVTMQIPPEAVKAYPDSAVRAAFGTLSARDAIPEAESLSLLPFTTGDLANFRVAAVVPQRAVLLSDAEKDKPVEEAAKAAHIAITLGASAPGQGDDRDAFARRIFSGVTNLKEVRIISSEPLRLGGQMGHQIMAEARDAASNAELKVVQWLRFGSGAHLQMLGTARTEEWPQAFPRFRAVRDSVDLR